MNNKRRYYITVREDYREDYRTLAEAIGNDAGEIEVKALYSDDDEGTEVFTLRTDHLTDAQREALIRVIITRHPERSHAEVEELIREVAIRESHCKRLIIERQ